MDEVNTKLYLSGAGLWNEIVEYTQVRKLPSVGRLVSYWELRTTSSRKRFLSLLRIARKENHEG